MCRQPSKISVFFLFLLFITGSLGFSPNGFSGSGPNGLNGRNGNDQAFYPCFEQLLTKDQKVVLHNRAKLLNKLHPLEYLFLIRSMHPFWSQAQRNDLWINLSLSMEGPLAKEIFKEAMESVTNAFLLQTLSALEQKNMVLGRLVLHDQIQAMFQNKRSSSRFGNSQQISAEISGRRPVRAGRIDPVLAHSLRVDKFISSVEGLHPLVAMDLFARTMDKDNRLFVFHLMSDKYFALSFRLFAKIFFILQQSDQEYLVNEALNIASKDGESIQVAGVGNSRAVIAAALEELEDATENLISWKNYLSQDQHVTFIKALFEVLGNRGHIGFQNAVGQDVPEYAEELAVSLEAACKRFFGRKHDYAKRQLQVLAPLLASITGQELPWFERAGRRQDFSEFMEAYSKVALMGLGETLARPGIRVGLQWWKKTRQGEGVIEGLPENGGEFRSSVMEAAVPASAVKSETGSGVVTSEDDRATWALFLQFLLI